MTPPSRARRYVDDPKRRQTNAGFFLFFLFFLKIRTVGVFAFVLRSVADSAEPVCVRGREGQATREGTIRAQGHGGLLGEKKTAKPKGQDTQQEAATEQEKH